MVSKDIHKDDWDQIYAKRKEYEDKNPKLKISKRYKSYKNEKGEICCTKCGRGSDIGTCFDCKGEKEFLQIA